MPLGDERGDRNQSPSPSTLPSIRELFGIRTGGLSIHHPQHHSSPYSSPSARIARSQQPTDNLGTLVSTTQRAHRLGQPPPSAFPQQPLPSPAHGSPEPMHPIPVRSSSFSAGQVRIHFLRRAPQDWRPNDSLLDQVAGVNHIAQDRRSPPATRSPSSSITYATSPDQFNSRSARYPPSSHSPTSVGSQVLPPISVVVPEILPSNRVRAVSDSEALTRASFSSSSSSGHGAVRPVQPSFVENTAPSPQHLGSHTDTRADSTINHRRHVGRNTVQAPSGAHYPSSSRSHSRSIAQSSGLSDDAEQAAPWSTCSRSSSRNTIDYASASSTQEYPPHPYSPASLAARPGTSLQYSPVNHGGSSSSHSGYHGIEGPPYPAYVRGSERAPPSSFPQHGSHGSGNRPRSGNSSEGDETKSGYGKYQCEYCPKRFNRPSSLKVGSAIITIWTCHSQFIYTDPHQYSHRGKTLASFSRRRAADLR